MIEHEAVARRRRTTGPFQTHAPSPPLLRRPRSPRARKSSPWWSLPPPVDLSSRFLSSLYKSNSATTTTDHYSFGPRKLSNPAPDHLSSSSWHMPPMAATTVTTDYSITRRRFAVACGVLGQYVSADAPASGAMALMGPTAAVVQEPNAPVGGAQQLTIFYGGKVVVLDGCTPARAAELVRYTAAAAEPAPVDMPIARKASLRRFLATRKGRAAAATAPYGRPEPPPAKKGKTEARSEEASSWLALGSSGDMHTRGDPLSIAL